MRGFLTILVLLIGFGLYSQIEYTPDAYYTEKGPLIRECINVEYLDNQFKTFEKGKVCRESKWFLEEHRGIVWRVELENDYWEPLVFQEGEFWTFKWSEWKFEK